MNAKVQVAIADDSPFLRRLIGAYIEDDPHMEIAGTASDGRQAIELVAQKKPDVLTLDLNMPVMNGLEALNLIMSRHPLPVVVISGVGKKAAQATLTALETGAVDFILKYSSFETPDPVTLGREIRARVAAAAKVRVIRNTHTAKAPLPRLLSQPELNHGGLNSGKPHWQMAEKMVVIGASTGGPLALRELLAHIPRNFAAGIIIVQHLPASFTSVLAKHLALYTNLPVKEAVNGEMPQPGQVLIAPGGYHTLMNQQGQVLLTKGPRVHGNRPSINVTMQSVAAIYGNRTAGVVLTGMGDDGAMGLRAIRTKGGPTFVQNAASCIVNGMPRSALAQNVVDHIATPMEIAKELAQQFANAMEISL